MDVLDGPKFNLFEQMVSFKPNRYIFIPRVSFVTVVIGMVCLLRPCACEHAILYLYYITQRVCLLYVAGWWGRLYRHVTLEHAFSILCKLYT